MDCNFYNAAYGVRATGGGAEQVIEDLEAVSHEVGHVPLLKKARETADLVRSGDLTPEEADEILGRWARFDAVINHRKQPEYPENE